MPSAAIDDSLLEQGSAEWLQARVGKFTASVVHPLVATKGDGKGAASLIRAIVAERVSGIPQGFEGNEDTEFGHEHEPHARRLFQIQNGVFLQRVGLLVHPTMPYLAASPDGIVPGEFGSEFKSHRKARKFLEMIDGAIPRAHVVQCQVGMACAGVSRWAYSNYCPEMPESRRLHTRWVERDEALIAEITVAVKRAEAEVAARVAEILNS